MKISENANMHARKNAAARGARATTAQAQERGGVAQRVQRAQRIQRAQCAQRTQSAQRA